MESTANFQAGFEAAYKELKAEGKVNERDERAVTLLLANPVLTAPNGERVFGMARAHRRVRRYYLAKTGQPWGLTIDWEAIKQWIKDHWVDILKIILSVLFLFII